MNIAMIIAGGIGERMKQEIPKQFLSVFNKPIIVYTMDAFQKCDDIDSIIVVSLAGWDAKLWEYAKEFQITKLKKVIIGGACGQESIYNGIMEMQKDYRDDDIVLIHDAIRPMVSAEIIKNCIDVVKRKGNAITVIPCQEAMLETLDQEVAFSSYPRNQLKRTQTPQGFYLKDMINMHKEAKEKGITNSIATCTLAVELGKTLYFSNGSEKNLKITTLDDLYIFQALLQEEKKNKKMFDLWSSTAYQDELIENSISDNIWSKLYGKTILITGATGMVCSFLVDVLMKRNEVLCDDEKICLVIPVRDMDYAKRRFSYYVNLNYFYLIKLDVTSIQHELDDFTFDYMIIGAGYADPKHFSEHPVDTMKSNLYGLTNFLEIAKNSQGTRVLYVSTGEVYGNAGTNVESFREEDSYYVNSMELRACYPNSKRAAETFCVAYHRQYDVDVVIGRLCYVYGSTIKDSDSRSVAQFLHKAVKGEDIVLKSKGEQVRSYCYIADAISALLFLMVYGVKGEAYNIAGAESNCSIAEFAGLVAQKAGVNCIYTEAEEREKAGYSRVTRAVQCPDKINTLGWRAKVSLESGVERTLKILMR